MSYTVIARKYRPKNFNDLIGQKPLSDTLKNAIQMKKIYHAYLFSGPRGVGKTSTARILAKSLNCKTGSTINPCDNCQNCKEIAEGISMDVFEIDGASNRGIDEIRDLKEKINYRPINSIYKIYIIDEVHMLTPEAFNALLKTLEEPPDHIIFMFATTEPHKIPLTVLSRCQRFDFRRITITEITAQLEKICKDENVKADNDALFLLSKNSDGSMRDAQSALDQLIAYSEGEITVDNVRKMFGLSTTEIYHLFLSYIKEKDISKGVEFISKIYNQGLDLKLFITNFINFLRNIFLISNGVNDEGVLEESKAEIENLKKWTSDFEVEVIDEMIKYLVDFLENFRYSTLHKILVETVFLNLIDISKKISLRFIYKYINSFGESLKSEIKPEKFEPVIEKKIESEEKNVTSENVEKDEEISEEGSEISNSHSESNSPENEFWHKIIETIDEEKKSIASFLKKGKLKKINDNVISVLLENQFLFNSLNNQKGIIEKIIEQKLNKKYVFDFELSETKEDKSEKEEKPDPVIQKAKKIFKGRIINKEAYS